MRVASLYSISCKVRQYISLHFNKKLWPYSLQVRFFYADTTFDAPLIQIHVDTKKQNAGSEDHDGVDKKGPSTEDTNISPISKALSNSVYLLVLSKV